MEIVCKYTHCDSDALSLDQLVCKTFWVQCVFFFIVLFRWEVLSSVLHACGVQGMRIVLSHVLNFSFGVRLWYLLLEADKRRLKLMQIT